MIIKRWLTHLGSLRREVKDWRPPDDNSARISNLIRDLIDSLEAGMERLEKELESRLAQELQMEMALAFAEDAVSVTTKDGDIRMVNPAFGKLTGYPGEQIIGSTHEMLWSNAPAVDLADMQNVLASGKNWRGELNLLTRDGSMLITEVTAVPIIKPNGEITHHVFTQRDITQRLAMERKLGEQKSFLEKVINLTSNVIIVLGPKGEWKLDNLAAKTLLTEMGENTRKRLADLLLVELGNESVVRSRRLDIGLTKNKKGYYLMQAERIPARFLIPDSEAGYLYLVTLSDITEVEQKNREILVRHTALVSSKLERSLAQEELAGGFVYQMRQPLNVVKAIGNRMEELLRDHDMEGLFKNANLLREHLGLMEKNMARFKKITANKKNTEGKPCLVSQLVESLEFLFAERCGESGVNLEINAENPDTAFPLPLEVMQMLMVALMDNSLESVEGRKEPSIKISFNTISDSVCISVEDSGGGVKEEDCLKVFEPFYTTKPGKRGLSLALLHQVVDKAGGRVELKKSSLGGAFFVLGFPKEA
ncbi:MAG: hypothetical protein IEMM0002_0359 [bacterium]|nr:MAG: hypothetical protein IEMM0002_0359 [bacterium]